MFLLFNDVLSQLHKIDASAYVTGPAARFLGHVKNSDSPEAGVLGLIAKVK